MRISSCAPLLSTRDGLIDSRGNNIDFVYLGEDASIMDNATSFNSSSLDIVDKSDEPVMGLIALFFFLGGSSSPAVTVMILGGGGTGWEDWGSSSSSSSSIVFLEGLKGTKVGVVTVSCTPSKGQEEINSMGMGR